MQIMANSSVLGFKGAEPKFEGPVFIACGAHVIGNLTIGEYSNIWFNTVVRADENWIKVGKYTNIQDNSVVHITHESAPTSIGDYVTIGHNAIIHGCTIESYSLIGMGAIVLDKAVIPRNSLVAAGAVVPPGKEYPEGHLILGNPAKAIRKLTEKELAYFEYSAKHYVELAQAYG